MLELLSDEAVRAKLAVYPKLCVPMKNGGRSISAATCALVLVSCLACTEDTIVISVMGPAELTGAEIFVDGEPVGTFGAPVGNSIDFPIRVPRGAHLFEVRKEGFETARETLQFQGAEGYMTVRVNARREIEILRG